LSKPRLAIAVLLAVLVALWLLTPRTLQGNAAAIELPDDLDTWLVRAEQAVDDRFGLEPGSEKRIAWHGDREPTPYSVVYLHGFSATRQETAPLATLVAAALGANLFETRLSGHGRRDDVLAGVSAEDWLRDAAEALAIGAQLGDKVIVIGTSTGATLVAAMLDHPAMQTVDTIVMMSPNFAPRDSNTAWLTRPAGPLLAKMLVGDTHSWTPHNDQQARFWATTYPTAAVVEMMRLVDRANRLLPASIPHRLLMFYSNHDEVISPRAAMAVFEGTTTPAKAAIEIGNAGDPSHHVLAGDILSPESTPDVARQIVEFISRPVP